MKHRDLRLVRVRTQTVVSVVLCQFAQCLLNSIFGFRCGGLLGCDTQIVCVDEAPCSIMDGLIACVDVEKDRERTLPWGRPFFCSLHLLRSLFSSTQNLLFDSGFCMTLHNALPCVNL